MLYNPTRHRSVVDNYRTKFLSVYETNLHKDVTDGQVWEAVRDNLEEDGILEELQYFHLNAVRAEYANEMAGLVDDLME